MIRRAIARLLLALGAGGLAVGRWCANRVRGLRGGKNGDGRPA